jgi:hypothetical protein
MIRLGQSVLDAMLFAHAVEWVAHGVPFGGGILGERHAIVGEHPTDLVGKRCDHAAHKGGPGGHFGGCMELDVSELGHTVDGQKHVHHPLG